MATRFKNRPRLQQWLTRTALGRTAALSDRNTCKDAFSPTSTATDDQENLLNAPAGETIYPVAPLHHGVDIRTGTLAISDPLSVLSGLDTQARERRIPSYPNPVYGLGVQALSVAQHPPQGHEADIASERANLKAFKLKYEELKDTIQAREIQLQALTVEIGIMRDRAGILARLRANRGEAVSAENQADGTLRERAAELTKEVTDKQKELDGLKEQIAITEGKMQMAVWTLQARTGRN